MDRTAQAAGEVLEDRTLLAAGISIDGDFSDWAALPSYTDPAGDPHDTDHELPTDVPALVDHPDVDLLEYKVTHDAENFYFYFQAAGEIGRTQEASGPLRAGRYYVIVTIDVDNDDSTGYWLNEGGYFPTSDGYDVNAEIEFYDGELNTRHYLNHGATNRPELQQAFHDQSQGLYDFGVIPPDAEDHDYGPFGAKTQGPFAPGFMNVLPGIYDTYTQWVYKDNDPALGGDDSITFVQDKGPIVLGIGDQASSADGTQMEMVFPYKGFLNDQSGTPIVGLGSTVDISFSLEASGELAPGGEWASDTGEPITGYFLADSNPPEVTLSAPTLTLDATPEVIVTATNAIGLPNGTAVSLDVDLNNDDDFDDAGELNYVTSTLMSGTSTFDVTPALIDGTYNFRARVSDQVGNEGMSGVKPMLVVNDSATPLDTYVAKVDLTYDYELTDTIVDGALTTYVIDMSSQTWRSAAEVDRPLWEHEVHILVPHGTTSETAILYIGSGDNGDPNQAIERANAEQVALHTGQVTVYLPTVPNQPLTFTDDGITRREDSILAYSFDKYLDGGDDEWPALLPMVKSAVRAMDTTQEFLANSTVHTTNEFFVTGGSKRGWTTYLTAAVDPRVSAITPVVFDYVNSIPALEFHQHVYAGVIEGTIDGYAEALQDYVNFDIFDRIGTPEYDAMMSFIDPYFYKDRLTQPKFAVMSTGDQFMPMAAQFYIDEFEGPTYLRYVPNTGHEAGRTEGKGFFKAIEAGEALPDYDWTVDGYFDNTIRLNSTTAPVEVNLWQATNPNSLDFRINYFGANWTSTPLTGQGGGEYIGTVLPPASGGTAFMVEMKYDVGGEILTFTTEARVVEASTVTTAIQSGDWHDPNTWSNGVPNSSLRAIVAEGITVTVNGTNHVADEIVVHGTLLVAEEGQLVPLDGGFETPVQPQNAFEQANGTGGGTLAGSAWTMTAGAGITRNLSPFQNDEIPAPEGIQHGLIQGIGAFTQAVAGFEAGQEYEFNLLTMARQFSGGGNSLEVTLDAGLASEMTLIDIPEVTFDSFTEVASPAFTATKDSYTLTIKSDLDGGNLTGDRTTMLDAARFRTATASTKTLTADWIHVNSGGVFQIGSAADRFDSGDFIITLTGTDQAADHVIETATGTMNVSNNDGFLMTAMGGRLQFFGEDKITFTKLAATAEIGSNSITVENIIERNFDGTTSAASDGQLNWEVGDTIVIASSTYDYTEEEVRTITGINTTGSQTILTLDSALAYRHYGEVETYGNGTRNWDIDLRAEVALLNRSITIQGTQDTDTSFGDRAQFGTGTGQNLGVGAHAMFMGSSGQITIDGVRFDQMGQTATLGRYPIHWHVAGDRSGDILRNSSITNSNNRGVTVHGTQGVRLEGNVLHDIHGHGFFMEDAAETDNEFLHNITFGIHKVGGGFNSNDPFVVPGVTRGGDGKVNGEAPQNGNGEGSHDIGQNAPQRFVHSAAYWITNPDNIWVGNVSAGSEGTGFWFVLPDEVLGLSRDTGLYDSLNPRVTNLQQFDDNTAHSGQVGMTFDRGEDISGGPQNNGYAPPQLMQTNFFTGYKNHGTAVYHRGPDAIFNESRFADNAFSSFNTFSQQEHNVLFVGHSRGNAELETTVGGYRLYDGPGRVFDSHFAGFTADNAHSIRIEGGANKFSHTTAEGISFEDDGTADKLGIEIYGDNFISVDETPVFISGRPDSFSGLVYDVDGSLTGHGGGGAGWVLTPKIDFYRDSTDLAPAGWNGYLSDDRFAQLRFGRINTADTVENIMPPFRISNGDGHSIIADRWNGLSHLQRLYVKLNAGDYTIEFLNGIPEDGFVVHSDAKTEGQAGDATVFRIIEAGRRYQPNEGNEVQSVEALRAASSNAWFRAADGDLWMKVFESPTQIRVLPTTPLVVTNTNDSGAGSLRSAITSANNNAGIDTIIFAIGAGGSTQTIQPQTPLPVVTDRVYIDGAPQTVKTFADGGFETAVQPNNSWELANGSGTGDLSASPWAFSGGAGITRNLSSFQRSLVPVSTLFVPAPEGQQHALIQGAGSFSQTVTGFEVGQTYDLNLFAMARQASDLGGSLQVTLDAGLPSEMTIVDIAELPFTRFTEVVGSEFTATKSVYTLRVSSDPGANGLSGDRSTFVDNVQFRRVGPAIELDGSLAGVTSGLTISAGGSGVKSLNINNFISGAGIHLHTAGGNVVEDVWAGIDVNGATAANGYGVGIESASNTVITSRLSGNTLDGIAIGGAGSTGNRLSRNSITGNGDQGIDLNDDGVTLNDSLDSDSGANDLSNFPVLFQVESNGITTTIVGAMNGLPETSYELEFYSNNTLAVSGYGGGEAYIGSTTVTTNAAGSVSFTVGIPFDASGQFITATSTDAAGNTSEFSAGIEERIYEFDFGDAPDTGSGSGTGNYQTMAADSGPSHLIEPTIFMGLAVDADSDGFGDGVDNNGDATDDDIEGGTPNDEDGINDPANALLLTVGASPTIEVTVTNTSGQLATLFGWIDYNDDGVFDNTTEFASVPVPSGSSGVTVTLVFPVVPVDAAISTFARFRLSSDPAAANPTGPALDGEVEDYAVHRSQTTGLFYNFEGASEELVLFSPNTTSSTYLIDKDANIVNQWDTTDVPGLLGYLLPDGSLMRAASPNGTGGNGSINAAGSGGLLEQYDWYGNKIWEFSYDAPTHLAHHDFEVLPNGNVLLIAWEYKTAEESLQAGRDPSLHESDILYPDHIIEVQPDYSDGEGGEIVWEWHVWDHLVQEFSNSADNWHGPTGVEDHPELVDINYVSTGEGAGTPREDWTHANGIDYNAELDQIVLSVREFSEFWIIDHSTTSQEAAGHSGGNSGRGGDILYRWGNPQTYDRGDENDRVLFYQHDAKWIEPGLPGAGNITVFNNGFGRAGVDFTTVEELTPPVDGFGNYPELSAGQTYGPAETVWTYQAAPEDFSSIISGTQRLQNGNQFVTHGTDGTFVEVTPAGEQVWRYVNPHTAAGTLGPMEPIPSFGFGDLLNNFTFRAISYSPDFFSIPPDVSISDAADVIEGVISVFTVSLDRTPVSPVTINYTTANDTADSSDYTSQSGQLIFNPGESLTQQVSIQTSLDATVESGEAFFVNLTSVVGGTIVDSQGQGTIHDRDISGSRGVLLETFYSIPGLAISDLRSSSNYPDSPDTTAYIDTFEAPTDIADDYGVRARGFLTAPTTGDYTFWIASDDQGELWLSSDLTAANASLIASVTGWTWPREWDKYASQQSVVRSLVAGEQYYIEALMKEGAGGDNLAIAWSGPGFVGPVIIDGQYLTIYEEGANSDPIATDDFANTIVDRVVVVPALNNDSDPDGHPLSITSFTQPASGTVEQRDGYGMLSYRADRTSVSNGTLHLEVANDDSELVYFAPSAAVGAPVLPDDFTIESRIGGEYDIAGTRSVALVVGAVNFLFHPGQSGGAFRVENPTENRTYVTTQDLGFTPISGVLQTIRVEVQRIGADYKFDVTITDGSDSSNVFMHTVTISASEVGLLDRFGYASRGGPASGTNAFDDLRIEDHQAAVLYETSFPGNLQDIGQPQLAYTPNSGFTGVDSFNYTISDGLGGTDTATVSVTVHALADFRDFGDAPDTGAGTGNGNYQTLGSDNGASHLIVPGLFMGAGVDWDSDGFGDGVDTDGYATDDDTEGNAPDDEDGVNDPTADLLLTVGESPTVDVTVTNTSGDSATLYGWIDYNGDGVFDNATERASIAVADGINGATATLAFPVVPAEAAINTFARFRLSSDSAAADPTGQAFNGEVEDYAVHQAQTTGLFFNKVGASEELTLFSPSTTATTYLIDKNANIVNQWTTTDIPGQLGYLLPDGSLMRAAAPNGNLTGNGSIIANGGGGLLEQFDWYGNKMWEFEYDSPTVLAHHDIEVLPNGNVLLIAWEYKTATESLQAGRDPSLHESDILYPDHIIEVQPDYSDGVGGDIVWEWHVWDHLVQEYDSSVDNWQGPTGVEDHPELVDINYVSTGAGAIPAREDWTHANGIDYNAELDQIVLSVREFSEFWVIDHSTTTLEAASHTGGTSGMGGDILYRWGNPQTYDRGDESDRKLFYQHDARWIAPGHPGAGNITVVSNGLGRPGVDFTSIEELTPPVDAFGSYPSLTVGETYGPTDTVWSYRAASEDTNGYQSGTQRLENGNQLITFARLGTLVEITPSGEQVWRYVSPYVATGELGPLDPTPSGQRNTVFKSISYTTDSYSIPPDVSISDALGVTEGGASVFTVSLDRAPVSAVTINFMTANDTADLSDYTSLSGQLVFNPGESLTQQVIIQTSQDDMIESDETFFVNLQSIIGGRIIESQGQGTILNDDVVESQLDITVHRTATTTAANGEVASLPESVSYIHEWEPYIVEVWGSTDGIDHGLSVAEFDLTYDTTLTTAVQIDAGPGFVLNGGTVDDGSGLVDGITVTGGVPGLGDDQFVLLARVRFEPVGSDQAVVDEVNHVMGPYAPGFALGDASVTVAGSAVTPGYGDVPDTELWAVPYDIDDNNRIDFGDFSFFAPAFGNPVGGAEPSYTWWADFDGSGSVDFGDFSFFAPNFGKNRVDSTITFPPNFPVAADSSTDDASITPVEQVQNINTVGDSSNTIDIALIALGTASDSDVVSTLPVPVTTVETGSNYVVEVWLSTDEATDITGGTLDLRFNPAAAKVLSINHGGVFTQLTSGEIRNETGLVDDFGGGTIGPGHGGHIGWVRLGYVTINAMNAEPVTFSLEPGELNFSIIGPSERVHTAAGGAHVAVSTDATITNSLGSANVNVGGTVPEKPVLKAIETFPSSSAPTLEWERVSGAAGYEIWFSRQVPAATRIFENVSVVTSTSFKPPENLESGVYRYWVRADGGPWSNGVSFEIQPTLIGPVTPGFNRRPTFEWAPIPHAPGYEIFIRSKTGDIRATDIEGNSYAPTTDLAAGPVRWWIRSSDAIGNRGWSDVGITGGPRTEVVAPTGTFSNTMPTFSWKAIEGAGRYILHVQNMDTAIIAVRENRLTGTDYIPVSALPAGNYRVWVKAINAATDRFDSGVWSRPLDFTITGNEAPTDGAPDATNWDAQNSQLQTDIPGPKSLQRVFTSNEGREIRRMKHLIAGAKSPFTIGSVSVPASGNYMPETGSTGLQLLDTLMADSLALTDILNEGSALPSSAEPISD